MSMMQCSLSSLGCVFGFASTTNRARLTAFGAFKISQRRLKPEVRAKLLCISSARTDATLAPQAWRFVFHDPATSENCRSVTVAAKNSSEHPDTVEAFSNSKPENIAVLRPVPQNKLLIDSDQALEKIRTVARLKRFRAVEFHLIFTQNSPEPCWTLQFYAENGEAASHFQIGAATGEIEIVGSVSKAA